LVGFSFLFFEMTTPLARLGFLLGGVGKKAGLVVVLWHASAGLNRLVSLFEQQLVSRFEHPERQKRTAFQTSEPHAQLHEQPT